MHLHKYYSDTLLVPTGHLAIATSLARGLDAIMDPVVGWMSDNLHSSWGRRKPFIAAGAPLCALFYILLFCPPADFSPEQYE